MKSTTFVAGLAGMVFSVGFLAHMALAQNTTIPESGIPPQAGVAQTYDTNQPALTALGTLAKTIAAGTLTNGVCEMINGSTTVAYIVTDDGQGNNIEIKPVAAAGAANGQGGYYKTAFPKPGYRVRIYGGSSPWISLECQ